MDLKIGIDSTLGFSIRRGMVRLRLQRTKSLSADEVRSPTAPVIQKHSMKISKRLLREAIAFHHRSLLPDLLYTQTVRSFLNQSMSAEEYLGAERGFNRFLYDYGVGRTIAAGKDKKIQLLEALRGYSFPLKNIPIEIEAFALQLQQAALSSNAPNGSKTLPLSFTSKMLFVMRPDTVMPYDSFARNSLSVYAGKPVKTLESYYQYAGEFRDIIEKTISAELKTLHQGMQPEAKKLCKLLLLQPDEHLLWRITDKYLWKMDEVRRSLIA